MLESAPAKGKSMHELDTPQDAVNARVDRLLEQSCTPGLVGAYFNSDGPFAGETFDTLGKVATDPHVIGETDLLAVTLMGVMVQPRALRQILGPDRGDLSKLLESVSVDTDLWDATDSDLACAAAVWNKLCRYRSIDWVTAGKLMARKRPRLIPVVDSVIVGAIAAPPHKYWTTFRETLKSPERRGRLRALRPSGLDERVSDLRVLDVVIWMHHSRGRSALAARKTAGCEQVPEGVGP